MKDNTKIVKPKKEINIEKLQKNKEELNRLLVELDIRKRDYWITWFDYNRIPQQTQLINDLINRLEAPSLRKKTFLYYGGNGAW